MLRIERKNSAPGKATPGLSLFLRCATAGPDIPADPAHRPYGTTRCGELTKTNPAHGDHSVSLP